MKKSSLHFLDCDEIDELDEINGDSQLALVWCSTHNKYEWHNLSRSQIKSGGTLDTDAKPLWS